MFWQVLATGSGLLTEASDSPAQFWIFKTFGIFVEGVVWPQNSPSLDCAYYAQMCLRFPISTRSFIFSCCHVCHNRWGTELGCGARSTLYISPTPLQSAHPCIRNALQCISFALEIFPISSCALHVVICCH